MPSVKRLRLSDLNTNVTEALVVSAAVSVVYVVLGFGVWLPRSELTVAEPAWPVYALGVKAGLIAIGIPLYLRLRYRLLGPLVLLGGVLAYWHAIVHLPRLPWEVGGSASFMLVLALAPLYAVGYAAVGIVEWRVRRAIGPTE